MSKRIFIGWMICVMVSLEGFTILACCFIETSRISAIVSSAICLIVAAISMSKIQLAYESAIDKKDQ